MTGNQEIRLDDADVVWVVLEGEGLVFATDAPGTSPSRPRNLVTRLTTGSVAAAVDGSSVGRRWILCGSARCVVAVVPFGALDGSGADGAPPLVALVDEWLDAASADCGEVVVGADAGRYRRWERGGRAGAPTRRHPECARRARGAWRSTSS